MYTLLVGIIDEKGQFKDIGDEGKQIKRAAQLIGV
jgi:hypothetical protein